MPFEPGTRLGSYEVLAAIGAGGMGEVYRARDTKLNRDVALKILPDAFASDPDRLARFTREAQTLAALNHQNIAAIYGFEEAPDVASGLRGKPHKALVMELVEGPDLAQRIAQGPIPLEEALAIARQIADAVEAAHELGIVHRDLKPANVKVRDDGTVKVLDFGLAKALEGTATSGVSSSWSLSPTITSPAMTGIGMIIGTAAYMAPEQAKGKAVDKRADIWAFGVVLFEMLTGRAMFGPSARSGSSRATSRDEGETVSEVLAAVIMRDPDLGLLPSTVPAPTKHLIARCLVKDPKLRLRDIGEARLALSGSGLGLAPVSEVDARQEPSQIVRTSRWLVAVAAALALALAITGFALWRVATAAPDHSVTRYEVRPPDKTALSLIARPSVALSPDGSVMAFVAAAEGISRIYVRTRDDTNPRALAGTEGASNPVFSPDGREIAFFAAARLKKTSLDGAVSTITEAGSDGDPRGITWISNDALVYSSAAAAPLLQVQSTGGMSRAVTTLDEKKGERTHRWPVALPGGKAVLFTVGTLSSPDNYDGSTIEAVVLATGKRQMVLQGASSARYVSTGHLLFSRGASLYAVGFDVDALTTRGAPVQVLQGVNGDTTTGASHLAVAENGTFAYVPGSALAGSDRLMWVDRHGVAQPLQLQQGLYFDPRISPDGTRVAVVWQTITAGTGDVWVSDFARNTFTRLSLSGKAATPTWSADGKTIYYVYIDPNGRKSTIMRKPADGSREAEPVVVLDSRAYIGGITPDGKSALISYLGVTPGSGKTDQMKLALTENAKPEPLVATLFDETGGAMSPDGRWLAYGSDETGRGEVYVRDMSTAGGRWQVSTTGGEEPHWSPDGRELYYRNETTLMSVSVDTRTTFEPKTPVVLFDGVYNLRSDTGISYAVDPKGDRFLMIRLTGDNVASGITVVLNWFDDLRRLTAARN